ncbi:hypothetical protein BO70DRAFT_401405 [Aspergillus heteromorphus CBS 117.55]|uniref:Uncharacterized protein n=1 Tax=Aspergillus heteromorphus CBS 117.55 TaxID=1448321 RepID=A0A317URL7_9EURO|nr:uncharacterized protein BO70DRAFT_401405 [Aspergillus heteromorphus CBS 117.55]PWY64275.1 hypothetical protein BO70DRAFT_401405 [Aspergillus heteromorphus CBS 117.55]
MDAPDQSSGANRRRQAWSFSLSIRPSASRRNRTSTPPPTCEESVHYPIFNPRDPRHNPSAASSWVKDDYYAPQHPNPSTSIRWMQDLPRRSLRRAHSGFLAFTSGMRRRPITTRPSQSDDIPRSWSSTDSGKDFSDQQATLYSSTVSEASTEEDVDFGTDLQRIRCKYPPETDDNLDRYLQSLPCPFAWDDWVPSGSAAGPSHRPEALAPAVPNVRSARSSHTGATEAGSHEMALNEIRAPPGDGSAEGGAQVDGSSQQVPSASGSYVSLSTGSENEGLALVSSASGNPQLPPATDDTPESATGSAFSSSRISSTLPVPTIEVTSCPTMPRDCASERPQVADTELAMESLALFDRLGLDEGQSGEDAMESKASESVPEHSGHSESQSTTDCNSHEAPLHDNHGAQSGGDSSVPGNASEGPDSEHAQTDVDCTSPAHRTDPREDTTFGTDGAGDRPEENADAASVLESSSSHGDLTLLLALRDEYFLVDKSNDLRPDRGNGAAKAERSFSGDGCLYSGPGLDRNSSHRPQEIPEMIGPRTPLPVHTTRPFRVERDASDSTDEYLMTYPGSPRHYFS